MATNPSTLYHLKTYLSFLGNGNEDLALVFQSLHFLRRYAALVHRGLQYFGCDGDLGPATRWWRRSCWQKAPFFRGEVLVFGILRFFLFSMEWGGGYHGNYWQLVVPCDFGVSGWWPSLGMDISWLFGSHIRPTSHQVVRWGIFLKIAS